MVATHCLARFKGAGTFFLLIILGIVLSGNIASAQTCSGTLGEPIVNITFGAGTGVGPALDAGTTNLITYTTGCPQDGQYTIVNKSTICYTDNWHAVNQDHTGDPNGRFMLVNASVSPSDFYVKQIDGLCSGTTYQFSAWIMNMVTNTGGDPDITFSIEKTDGTVIASQITNDIPKTGPATWVQHAFNFTIPNGVSSVVIRMRNNAPGGLGNDLALDDITFRPTGPGLTVGIQGVNGTTATICPSISQVTLFTSVGICFPNTAYQWQESLDNGTTWANVSSGGNASTYLFGVPTATATYLFRVLVADEGNTGSANCRVISNTLTVNVTPNTTPVISIAASATNICAAVPVTFSATASNVGASPVYQWQINGVAAGLNSASFSTSNIHDGDVVSCTLSSSSLCSTPAVSNSVTMHVSGVITAATISTATNSLCEGTAVTFTANTGGGVTGLTYQWLVNGVNAGSNVGTFTPTNIQDGDVVTCRLSSSAGCFTPFTTNSITMRIAPSISSVTITASANNVCAGNSITFTANQTSATNYQWLINNIAVGSNSPTFTSSTINDGDVVSCKLVSNATCTTPVLSNNITMHISQPLLSVVISASATTICKGTPVTFTVSADQTKGVGYQWMINGAAVKDTVDTLTTLIRSDLNNNDAVTCRVTSNCNTPIQPNPITITVEDIPQIIVSQTAYQINQGEHVNLATSAVGDGLTYQWSPALGLDKTNIPSPTASPVKTTAYTLQVTNLAGCTATAGVTVKVIIKQIVVPNSFTPNNDGVNDTWEIPGLDNDATAKIQVYNRYGASVYNSVGYNTPWNGTFKGKLLPAGVYYYAIRLTDNSQKLAGFVTIIR